MAEQRLWIELQDVPQANAIRRLIALVRHIAIGAPPRSNSIFHHRRDLAYYVRAAKAMRLLDQSGRVTPGGRALSEQKNTEALTVFARIFAASPCGATWLAWQGVMLPEALEAGQVDQFLEQCTALSPKTRRRRAATLRSWLKTLFPVKDQTASSNAKKTGIGEQLRMADWEPQEAEPCGTWPAPERFPHNEGGAAVEKVLAPDFAHSPSILLITGYASLDRVVQFLDQRDFGGNDVSRLMFGNDPYFYPGKSYPLAARTLADEIRDYWLGQGVSILLSGALLRVRQLVVDHQIQFRTATRRRPVHAKIYCTDDAVTLGSSNYSQRGLQSQTEGNARFERVEKVRYQEATQLAEGIWKGGVDYREEFLKLLEQLFLPATWREALARACAALLEGDWAKRYLALGQFDAPPELWPHQLQGIDQALWVLENVGSVLIADATGSGKTRMGAWLLRAAYVHQVRAGQSLRGAPVVIVPPQVKERWEEDLERAQLRWKVDSHGPLSQRKSNRHGGLVSAVGETELLAVDEAHNYINRSERTRMLLSHYADHTVLFTATPINRTARDLLGIIELLGADNLSEESIQVLRGLRKMRKLSPSGIGKNREKEFDRLKAEIERFMVRRTRSELSRIASAAEFRPQYQLGNGKYAQYPEHRSCYYPCDAPPTDCRLAQSIEDLCSQLTGIGRVGSKLELPRALAIEGMTEEQYLWRVLKSSQALARHFVMDCLRSSSAALYEHIHGTEAAIRHFAPTLLRPQKDPSGDTASEVRKRAGNVPTWRLKISRSIAPTWLVDAEVHRETCRREADLYEQIAALVIQISGAREAAKLRKLVELSQPDQLVLAFDSHVITLEILELQLRQQGHPVEIFTGVGGASRKKFAEKVLGLNTNIRRLIALCSDTLSEGMNLQGASRVVHLDTPTVIRTAEQRAGRIDRINSPHPIVEIWWPQNPPEFAPRKRDLLRERHSVVSRLIGANLKLPGDTDEEGSGREDERLTAEQLVERIRHVRQQTPEFFDAFRPVRELIGPRGLISDDVYRTIRTSTAQVLTRISIIAAEQAWAFFVVTGIERAMPRWVLLESETAEPIVDLAAIASGLRDRLACDPHSLALDKSAEDSMSKFVHRLQQTEWSLLPARRQRALRLAKKVLEHYADTAWSTADEERRRVSRRMLDMLRPGTEDPYPDPRSMSEAWLRLVRPYQQRMLTERRRKQWPWTINEIEPLLITEPIPTEQLKQAFAEISLLPPIRQRIVTMILGISETVGGAHESSSAQSPQPRPRSWRSPPRADKDQ